jgi:DNA-binding NtrC family response regulator
VIRGVAYLPGKNAVSTGAARIASRPVSPKNKLSYCRSVAAGDRTLSYPTDGEASETPVRSPYLVVALDCSSPSTPPLRLSIAEVDRIDLGRGEARKWSRTTEDGEQVLAVELADRHLSSAHARIERRRGSFWLVDRGSKNGCFLNGTRVADAPLDDSDLIEIGNTILLLRTDVERLASEAPDLEITGREILPTLSPPLARALADTSRCASTSLPILITGASGTGKEVAARWIHKLSGRKGDLIAINCAALPENLVESELFGSTRGSFSGADRDRIGLVRAADKGTLFLDEVGELPLPVQVKLLRVLQEREVTAIGATRAQPVDIRVVSATLQDVDAAVADGRLREDLVARLSGFRLQLPLLYERIEDIGMLIGKLLARFDGGDKATLTRSAARALIRYEWPLNIRELEHNLGRALALADDRPIDREHLPGEIASAGEPMPAPEVPIDGNEEELYSELIALLRRHRGNISAVARDLDRARVQIRRWCKRFDIDVESFR